MSEFDNNKPFDNGNTENGEIKNENEKIEEASYSCSDNNNGAAQDNETFYHRAPGMQYNGQYNGYNGNSGMNFNNRPYGNQGYNNSNGQPNYAVNPSMNQNNTQQYGNQGGNNYGNGQQGYGVNPNYNNGQPNYAANPNMNYNNGQKYGNANNPNYNNGQQYGNQGNYNYNNGQYRGGDPFVSGNMAPLANVQPQKSRGGKGMGIASMVCGILSLTMSSSFIAGIILSIVGLVLGIVAQKRRPSAFSKVGIITSSIGVGLSILLGIFFLIIGSSWLDLIASIISETTGGGDPFDPNNGACVEIVRSVLFRLGL